MSSLLNLTPHAITLHRADGVVLTLPPETTPARVTELTSPFGTIGGVPLVRVAPAYTDALPEPRIGTFLIVSTPVAIANPHRPDLVVPHDFVRDDTGRILGCRALARRIS